MWNEEGVSEHCEDGPQTTSEAKTGDVRSELFHEPEIEERSPDEFRMTLEVKFAGQSRVRVV